MPDPSQVTAAAAQTPCCSVAHYLFPTQRQHQESPPLMYQNCVGSRGRKQLGHLLTHPPADGHGVCDEKLWNGRVFWTVKTLLLYTWHNGRAWEPVQFRTRQTNAFSHMLVITVSVIRGIRSPFFFFVFKGGFTCLKSVFMDAAEYTVFGPATFQNITRLSSNNIQEGLTSYRSVCWTQLLCYISL